MRPTPYRASWKGLLVHVALYLSDGGYRVLCLPPVQWDCDRALSLNSVDRQGSDRGFGSGALRSVSGPNGLVNVLLGNRVRSIKSPAVLLGHESIGLRLELRMRSRIRTELV